MVMPGALFTVLPTLTSYMVYSIIYRLSTIQGGAEFRPPQGSPSHADHLRCPTRSTCLRHLEKSRRDNPGPTHGAAFKIQVIMLL